MAEKKKKRELEQLQKENGSTGNKGSIGGTDKMGAFVDVYHPQKQYGLIYIDPPWEQARGGRKRVRPNSSGRGLDYPVMPLEKIIQFHKTVLPLLAKERHNVFMWTIDKFLIPAESFMQEMGYVRHARIVWNKLAGMAPAYTVRFTCEYLVWFYPKGRMLFPDMQTRGKYPTIMEETVKRHSQKPECAYRMLEDMFRQTEKIELFARRPRDEWDFWGNEVAIPDQGYGRSGFPGVCMTI